MKTNRSYTFLIFMSVLLINKSATPMSHPVHPTTNRPISIINPLFTIMSSLGKGIIVHQTANFGIRVLRNPTPKELEKKLGRKLTKLITTTIGFSACILSYHWLYLFVTRIIKTIHKPTLLINLIPNIAFLHGVYYG